MGIIFHRTLKCENCGYEHQGKCGGHVISNGERYSVSQYYCNSCHKIVDLECYSSLRENVEKYIYPDGTEVSYNIEKTEEELNIEAAICKLTNRKKDLPPYCRECGQHLFKFDINSAEASYCPKCGEKTLKQKDINVVACID